MGGKRGASLRQEEETDPPPPTGEVRQTVPKRSKQETAASSSTQHLPVHPLDHLPRPALSRIVFHTSDIKQKLRLALTCRRLYYVVTRDAEAWPATVLITHGYITPKDYKSGVIQVSVSGKGFYKNGESEERQLLPVTSLERLLSVLHLPAVCPVPVELRLLSCAKSQRRFLKQHVLPWLELHKADASRLFSTVHLDFEYGNFKTYSRLLYVWCDAEVPFSLRLFLESQKEDWCDLIRVKQLPNVHRLSLSPICEEVEIASGISRYARILRRMPNVTDVEFDLDCTDFLWWNWEVVWSSFVASRAEPTRPHTLRVVGNIFFVLPELAEPIGQLQPGYYVGISNIVRQTLNGHLSPEVLEAIEEHAEVNGVTLSGIHGDTIASSGSFRKHLLTLHLLMKKHQQAEWTIEISGN